MQQTRTRTQKAITLLTITAMLMATALLLLIAGCSKSVQPLSKLAKTDVVLAFGDSLTYGTGVTSELSYPSILANRIGRTVINEGMPGELSADGLLRLPELLNEHKPALVILCHGGNDFLHKQPIEQLEQNLKQMIQLIKGADAEVLLVGVPQPKLLMLFDAEVYAKVAKEMNLPYVENALSEILSQSALKSDAVHPNAQGYQRLANAVEAVLTEAKAI
jgi:lysophospholipase L1-like esterase